MRRKHIVLLSVLILLAGGAGVWWTVHSSHPRLDYAYICDHPPHWRIAITLNGQPARTMDQMSGMTDVTVFVIDGENSLLVEATPRDEGAGEEEVHLARVRSFAASGDGPEMLHTMPLAPSSQPVFSVVSRSAPPLETAGAALTITRCMRTWRPASLRTAYQELPCLAAHHLWRASSA